MSPNMHTNIGIILYFGGWVLLFLLCFILNYLNIDWDKTSTRRGFLLLLLLTILQGSAMEFVLQTLTTLILYKEQELVTSAKPVQISLILNYNLLAVTKDDIEDAYETMYQAYITNLSPNISAVLVSATKEKHLKEYELKQRDLYRSQIYHNVKKEGHKFALGHHDDIDRYRLEHVWGRFSDIDPNIFLTETLEDICRRFSREFMCIHRVSKVLKKCGQYQDLMLLSQGDTKAFTYTDKALYGCNARPYDENLFHTSQDVDNICGRQFEYTLVLDSDTFVPPGAALELMSLAAENPSSAIIQPAIKLEAGGSDTLYSHLESLRQRLNEPITNSMAELLGQSGFYGKALIKNDLYIKNVIGTRENIIERVPIDVLSHDTFEAAVLKPLYAGSITLLEAPSFNFVTWNIRETRWNRGEVILSMYFWSTFVGKPMRFLQKAFQGDAYMESDLRTESKLSFVSSYMAHSALRQMFMKPALLCYIVLQMNVSLHYPHVPIAIMLFIVVIFPKFAITTVKNLHLVLLETVASVIQFTPEAIVGCVRIYQAYKELIFKSCCWVPQRVVEEEFRQSNPMLSTIKYTWGYSVLGFICILLISMIMPLNFCTHFLFCTVLVLPIYMGMLSFTIQLSTAAASKKEEQEESMV